jgi:chromosome segregation ATPase
MVKRRRIGDLIKQEIDKNDQSPEPEQMPETKQSDSASHSKVQELEAELVAKDKTIAKLEKDLAATKQLKSELDSAKKDALNLAKENTSLKNRIDETRHAHNSGGALVPHEVVAQSPEPVGDFALNTWLL